jgi:hypothetical protein
MYASLFQISGALHLDVFEQPEEKVFFGNLRVVVQESVKGGFLSSHPYPLYFCSVFCILSPVFYLL